ncbi:hypothetical protein FOB65_00970 (plasmid) [Pseudomonas oryzihabitans]|nr:hypothetical protein FOB65_00970 [Pseudomonas oryzihabitans]
MRIEWLSRQGKERSSNNDAAAIGYKGNHVLALVVDASDKANGQAFSRHWATTIVKTAMEHSRPLDIGLLEQVMWAEQRQLRSTYLHTSASYCCALIDLGTRTIDVRYVGDCMFGTQAAQTPIQWVLTPHTLYHQAAQMGVQDVSAESRHILTRSLNARRYCEPGRTSMGLPDARLIICSDGYWNEHLTFGIDLDQLSDDASVLSLDPGAPALIDNSDCQNIRVFDMRIP